MASSMSLWFQRTLLHKIYIASEIGLQGQKLSDCSKAEAERQKKNITALQFILETCWFHISLAWWQKQNDQYA